MSGALIDVFASAQALIDGTTPDDQLRASSFRGVPFQIQQSSDAAGRRLVPFVYPGVDQAQYVDLGFLDGGIRIEGLIAGPGAIERAQQLRTAFQTAGSGILSHAWLGDLVVYVSGEQPPEFLTAENELSTVRFRAVFVLGQLPAAPAEDTLGAVLDQADAVLDSIDLAYEQVLSAIALPAALVAGVDALFGTASTVWTGLLGGAPADVSSAIANPLAAIAPSAIAATPALVAPSSNTSTVYADAVSAALLSVPASVASVVVSGSPAIGASGQALGALQLDAATGTDPRDVTNMLLSATTALTSSSAGTLAAGSAQSVPLATLAAGAAGQALAQAVASAGAIGFTSQTDAVTWRTTLTVAIAAWGTQIDALGSSAPTAALAMRQSANALADAVNRDIDQQLGRLPRVISVQLPQPASVWLVALALAGDAPATMASLVSDLVTRNDVANPAEMPAGWIETLQATATGLGA